MCTDLLFYEVHIYAGAKTRNLSLPPTLGCSLLSACLQAVGALTLDRLLEVSLCVTPPHLLDFTFALAVIIHLSMTQRVAYMRAKTCIVLALHPSGRRYNRMVYTQ